VAASARAVVGMQPGDVAASSVGQGGRGGDQKVEG